MTASEQARARVYADKLIPELLRDMRDGTSGEQLLVLYRAVERGYEQGRIDASQQQRGSV